MLPQKVFKDLSGVIAGLQQESVMMVWCSAESNEKFPGDITEPEYNVNSIQLTPSGPMKTHYGCFRLEAHQRH